MNISIGETYQSPNHGQYIYILGIHSETATGVNLAIYWVDPRNMDTTPGDIYVSKDELKTWKKLEL